MSTIHSIDRYAVIGHPISHSLSPVIHAAFATQTGQHLTYEAIDVAPATLDAMLSQLPATGYRGINITVPHKETAWAYAQQHGQLTERARLAGAINTLAWRDDGLLGDNTDGQGLLNDLQQRHGLDLSGKKILLLGAGGASRGVILPCWPQSRRHWSSLTGPPTRHTRWPRCLRPTPDRSALRAVGSMRLAHSITVTLIWSLMPPAPALVARRSPSRTGRSPGMPLPTT